EAIVVVDLATGLIVLANPAAEQMFGYAVGELIGLPLQMLIPPELRGVFQGAMEQFRIAETPPGNVGRDPVEVSGVRKDGGTVDAELSFYRLDRRRPHGQFGLAIVRDMTARKR